MIPPEKRYGKGGPMTELQRLALRYVAERHARGEIGQRTAEGLRSKLWDFTRGTDARPGNVNRRHVEQWLGRRPGLSPAYQRARLSAVRVFCEWCVIHGHMRRDPTLGIPAPRIPTYLPRSLPATDVGRVLAQVPDQRGRVIVLLSVQEGLRRCEVARAELGDIDLHNETMGVRGKGGHGRVTRTVPLSTQTVQAIDRYLVDEGHRAGPLVRNRVRPDRGLTPHTVGDLVAGWMADAGVKQAPGDGRSMHALRHSCANHMLDEGATLPEVQQMLGHSSVRNTEVYTRGRVENLRGAAAGRSY